MISNDETHQEEKEDLNYDSYDDEADNYSDDEFGLEEEAIPSDIQARRLEHLKRECVFCVKHASTPGDTRCGYSHVGNRFQAAEQQRLGQQQPTGTLTLVDTEKDVMDMTTAHAQVVVHFAHRDFKRCRIMDAHLQVYNYMAMSVKLRSNNNAHKIRQCGKQQALARQYPNTRFIKIFVENASFLVERLKIRVLPCVVCFVDAVTVDKYALCFCAVCKLKVLI